MGCFSFICTECGEPINSDSFSGENVRLSLLDKGKVIESLQEKCKSLSTQVEKQKQKYADKKIEYKELVDDIKELQKSLHSLGSEVCAPERLKELGIV